MKIVSGILLVALGPLLWIGAGASMMGDPMYAPDTPEYKAAIASNEQRAVGLFVGGIALIGVGAMLIGRHLSERNEEQFRKKD